jgi:hypothetical protein
MPPVADQRHDHEHASAGPDASVQPVASLPSPGLVAVPGLGGDPTPLRRHLADPLGGSEVPGDISGALRRRAGQGDALPGTLAAPMAEGLGLDLSGVRVHTDPEAGRIARSLQATAFTHGNDIYFAPGAYRPGSTDGQRVLAHEVSHIAAQRSGADRGASGALTVGRANDPAEAAADRSADQLMTALRRRAAPPEDSYQPPAEQLAPVPAALRRWPWSKSKNSQDGQTEQPKYPRTVVIGSESIVLEKKEDEDEANTIIKELKDNYGIDLSSTATVGAIKTQYTRAPSEVKNALRTSSWSMRELRALAEAASFYAPILGTQRDESTLASSVQGVTTVGKLRNAIDTNSAKGKLDRSTLGEYFSGSRNLGLFDAGTKYQDKNFVRPGKRGTDVQTSLTATAIHEMAHGLVQPLELTNWIAALAYWTDRSTASGKKGAEKPPTSYGKTNAAEDLCESVALYFINRATLQKKCPDRDAFIDKVVKGWTPEKAATVEETATESKGSESPPPTTSAPPQQRSGVSAQPSMAPSS